MAETNTVGLNLEGFLIWYMRHSYEPSANAVLEILVPHAATEREKLDFIRDEIKAARERHVNERQKASTAATQIQEETYIAGFKAGLDNRAGEVTPTQIESNAKAHYGEWRNKRE